VRARAVRSVSGNIDTSAAHYNLQSMSEWLTDAAVSFLGALDRLLVADLPFSVIAVDPDTLALSEQAADLACQRSNVLIGHTIPLLLLWDCADAFLAWLADPLNDDRQVELMAARIEVDDICGIGLADD
jgi:hypothetical protein